MSNATNEVKAGCIAAVKIGRNEIPVVVVEILGDGYRVKSTATNKEFNVRKIERVITPPPGCLNRKPDESERSVKESVISDTEDRPNLASESATPGKREKKLSLLDAAVEVLKADGKPMNTRELVKAATESGLWIPTACKTPEQTLYGGIFREINGKDSPRFRKSAARKGAFEYDCDRQV